MSKYLREWQDYRRRRNLLLFASIGYVPACGVFGVFTMLLFHSDRPIVPFAICWMAFGVFANMRFNGFRCPRCGNMFFFQDEQRLVFKIRRGNQFASKCLHCGLPKYAGEDTHAL